MHTIEVYKGEDGTWMTHNTDPRVLAVCGTAEVPTPWFGEFPGEEVVKQLQAINPDCAVSLRQTAAEADAEYRAEADSFWEKADAERAAAEAVCAPLCSPEDGCLLCDARRVAAGLDLDQDAIQLAYDIAREAGTLWDGVSRGEDLEQAITLAEETLEVNIIWEELNIAVRALTVWMNEQSANPPYWMTIKPADALIKALALAKTLSANPPSLLDAAKAALAALRDPNGDDYFDADALETMLEEAIQRAELESAKP